MLEIVGQCLRNDFVETMVFALIPKRALPAFGAAEVG